MAVDPQDLTTVADATLYLAAGGTPVTAAQTAVLQALVTEASRLICRYCRRRFALTAYDEVLTPLAGQPDKGEPDTVQASNFPVQSVTRLAGGRATGLTVANSSASVQRALAQLTFTGDPEITAVRTGLTLTTYASGVSSVSPLTWTLSTPFTTVGSLAASVNALGGGWTATAGAGLSGWAAADLYGPLSPLGARNSAATFSLFAEDLSYDDLDMAGGVVALTGYGGSGFLSGGPDYPRQVRWSYSAGWAVIPEPVATACIELVKATLDRLKADGSLESEKAKDYEYKVKQSWQAVPDWVRGRLSAYTRFV